MAAEVMPGDIKEVRDAIASGDGKALSSLDDVVRSGRSNDIHPMFNSLRDLVDREGFIRAALRLCVSRPRIGGSCWSGPGGRRPQEADNQKRVPASWVVAALWLQASPSEAELETCSQDVQQQRAGDRGGAMRWRNSCWRWWWFPPSLALPRRTTRQSVRPSGDDQATQLVQLAADVQRLWSNARSFTTVSAVTLSQLDLVRRPMQ